MQVRESTHQPHVYGPSYSDRDVALRASGDMACPSFGRLRCDTSIYSRAARYKPIDTSEAAEAAL